MNNRSYLYLLAPLHTGGTTQEGNLLGIARESHTNLPYIPSSTIRGRLRSSTSDRVIRIRLFGPDFKDIQNKALLEEYELATGRTLIQLEQGDIWIGDASVLWLPVSSLSHGAIWISCPMLLRRWGQFDPSVSEDIPAPYSTNLAGSRVYLKDAILQAENLQHWEDWQDFIPQHPTTRAIERVLVLPDQHCATLIQMGLWRQVKVKLDENKTVEGGFRYEEAIPPDTLMYFPWGMTGIANSSTSVSQAQFEDLLEECSILQLGGQESLGRGFVQQWSLPPID
ncbi:MAG: type III-B CRISPR module RAMP protein Cmr4 [Oscillatoria sp. SIO1A7]|nr:type III-B CRISPR module RAMP protein Cmr4 [Oscillatoria sp. SIO1A7]